jgi:hypothetical protein
MTSIDILGLKLGAECTATKACFVCNKSGNWSGECPKFWFDTLGKTLPGYCPNGRRLIGDWDANKYQSPSRAELLVIFYDICHDIISISYENCYDIKII